MTKSESKGMHLVGPHCARPHEFGLQEPKAVWVSGQQFNKGATGAQRQTVGAVGSPSLAVKKEESM